MSGKAPLPISLRASTRDRRGRPARDSERAEWSSTRRDDRSEDRAITAAVRSGFKRRGIAPETAACERASGRANERPAERIFTMTERRLIERALASLALSRSPVRPRAAVPGVFPGGYRGIRPAVLDAPDDASAVARRSTLAARGDLAIQELTPYPKSLTHVQRTHFTPCFPARRIARSRRLAAAGKRGGLPSGAATYRRLPELTRVTGSHQGVSALPLSASHHSSHDAPFGSPPIMQFISQTISYVWIELCALRINAI